MPDRQPDLLQRTNPETVRRLILQHGINAASYQIVNPVINTWVTPDNLAVVGFVTRHRTDVLAGRPVSDPSRTSDALSEFIARTNRSLCVFAATEPQIPGLIGQGILIGQQPCWIPSNWAKTVLTSKSLRQQFNRAANKGVTVEEWPTKRAEHHPALHKILDSWLKSRGLPPLHFLVEPQTLSNLRDRRTFVALHQNEPVAFLNLCPIPKRNGWLTEQFPRLASAPNGTVELLMHTAAQQLAQEKFDYLTMGMVPLSPSPLPDPNATPLVRFILAWTRAHACRFYNFDGLYWFKNKFQPHSWENLYLVPDKGHVNIRHLIACTEAFTDEPLIKALPRALIRAIQQEARWLIKKP